MREICKQECYTVPENLCGKMKLLIKENLDTINLMEKENMYGLMVQNMMEKLKMDSGMVKVLL